jgi:hypothetical protein
MGGSGLACHEELLEPTTSEEFQELPECGSRLRKTYYASIMVDSQE